VIPTFIYLPIVYKLIGIKKERPVLYINLVGVIVNLIFSYWLILKLGLMGGFIGSMIAQWTILVGYYITLKKAQK
jgi:O-antigen/teichoic acid export membrane protein